MNTCNHATLRSVVEFGSSPSLQLAISPEHYSYAICHCRVWPDWSVGHILGQGSATAGSRAAHGSVTIGLYV